MTYLVEIAAPSSMPWGWMATPQATLERLVRAAGEGALVGARGGACDAAGVALVAPAARVLIYWQHSGRFVLAATRGEVPAALVAALRDFVAVAS